MSGSLSFVLEKQRLQNVLLLPRQVPWKTSPGLSLPRAGRFSAVTLDAASGFQGSAETGRWWPGPNASGRHFRKTHRVFSCPAEANMFSPAGLPVLLCGPRGGSPQPYKQGHRLREVVTCFSDIAANANAGTETQEH